METDMNRRHRERGSAMVETAITIPILLLMIVGIFEVGRAYETWQVLTNAAREGARISIVPSGNNATTTALVRRYMADGQLTRFNDASVVVDRTATIAVNGTNVGATLVTVDYPFEFIMLQPIARLVGPGGGNVGEDITMRATALMRNEAQ
jgi:Flp pilus assembly protein TadG